MQLFEAGSGIRKEKMVLEHLLLQGPVSQVHVLYCFLCIAWTHIQLGHVTLMKINLGTYLNSRHTPELFFKSSPSDLEELL